VQWVRVRKEWGLARLRIEKSQWNENSLSITLLLCFAVDDKEMAQQDKAGEGPCQNESKGSSQR